MKNISDTEAYTVYDFVFSKAARTLSNFIGVKRITRPFWDRWRASGIDDATIFRVLDGIATIDNWATVAGRVVDEEIAAFAQVRPGLTREQEVSGLRRLSYVANMAQWGSLPITDEKLRLYRLSRDLYVEGETLANGDRYRRIDVPWKGRTLHGNLHLPLSEAGPAPVVIVVHGIDGCKEEHLATELRLQEAGFCALVMDGPGQGEAMLLDRILWSEDFHCMVGAALDVLADNPAVDTTRVGLFGMSVGGLWALRAAAGDQRVRAFYDLGGPISPPRSFSHLPFLMKTKMCQVTGARDAVAIAQVLGKNSIENDATVSKVSCAVRIMHGGRDRVVTVAEKEWLRDQLRDFGHVPEVTLEVIPAGDHCCTGYATQVRADMVAFFLRHLTGLAVPAR
ncbi:MAG TPA: alpha/beta hydrolase [Xanthobacteraceae bacterium]|nr:alpha/beta hydrolase [Xanthobacteraceae bacterium]